jgi:hypothetical protein
MLSMTEKKKKKRGRPATGRTGIPLHAYIDATLAGALETYLAGTEPEVSKTAAVEAALRMWLKERGFWPPAQEEGE